MSPDQTPAELVEDLRRIAKNLRDHSLTIPALRCEQAADLIENFMGRVDELQAERADLRRDRVALRHEARRQAEAAERRLQTLLGLGDELARLRFAQHDRIKEAAAKHADAIRADHRSADYRDTLSAIVATIPADATGAAAAARQLALQELNE